MASSKAMNFAPGPAKVPEEVLEQAHREFFNYNNGGISVVELGHRGVDFGKINDEAEAALRKLYQIPPNYKVLFLQGGGTGQFAAVPLNLCSSSDDVVDYIVTGTWSSKAAQEAEKYCKVNRVLPKTSVYTGIPEKSEWKLSNNAKYVYYCANETIHGIEFDFIPETNGVPLVCDMSSNVLTRPIDVTKFGVIFAGAQKNAGIPGVTFVIVREDLLGKGMPLCPTVFDYKINAANKSLYNTPPTYSIYILGLVFKWVLSKGGVSEMDKQSAVKSGLVYEVLDASNGFYHSVIKKENRSRMNIPFRIGGPSGSDELETKFLNEAKAQKMLSLKGHSSGDTSRTWTTMVPSHLSSTLKKAYFAMCAFTTILTLDYFPVSGMRCPVNEEVRHVCNIPQFMLLITVEHTILCLQMVTESSGGHHIKHVL